MASTEQKQQVVAELVKCTPFQEERIKAEVDFWFDELGLPKQYFALSTTAQICCHVESYMASKVQARASGHPFDIRLRQESKNSALLLTRSFISGTDNKTRLLSPGRRESPVVEAERYIEKQFLSGNISFSADEDDARRGQPVESLSYAIKDTARKDIYRLQAYRSKSSVDKESGVHLRLYFLQAPEFANPKPEPNETRLSELGDVNFLKYIDDKTREVYETVMSAAVKRLSPVVHVEKNMKDEDGRDSALVMIAHRVGMTHSYFTGIPDVYRYYHMYATKKYVEPFSNGMVVFSFYLRSLDAVCSGKSESHPTQDITSRLEHLARDAALHFVLPRTSLTPLFSKARLSAQQVSYAYAAWKFAFHFLNRTDEDFLQISEALRSTKHSAQSAVSKLHASLKTNAFNEGTILDVMYRNTSIIEYLYNDFARRHMPDGMSRRVRIFSENETDDSDGGSDDAIAYLKRACQTELEWAVFSTFYEFNKHVLKTNFYLPHITALSFRLDPSFLHPALYPDTPYGVFYVVGSEFRAFHIRFHDVARGGIRLVRSRYSQAYVQNVATVFEECYNLANTQQRKNKDIPEGGSKGVILLNLAHQDKGDSCFKQFVDSILDLLLPNDQLVDLYGKEELLFLGPDEGTADYMDWASLHARQRGYRYWKAFTTGKSLSQGGIPHDLYGMTTRSVRAYVEGIQRKLKIDPAEATKMQTGGPDGDLGSNEIKLGKEKTIAIVDGSGVLCDPEGIDLEMLQELASKRQMVKHFPKRRLSDKGFLVLIDDNDVTLPDGSVVESGLVFRNGFHLNGMVRGDFFVPCGGRPAAVDLHNVSRFLYDDDNNLRFKYVVEGANLFFTQEARQKLEEAGVVIIKDASANKGGVTSSSLEVLAALSLTDAEFSEMMAQKEDAKEPPAFYAEYVKEVQSIITRNAELEFECLWREHAETGENRSVLSDILSTRITRLSDSIENSDTLWENEKLRMKVLERAIPKTIQKHVGLSTVLSRLPVAYKKALFASHLASSFIYKFGAQPSEFAFFDFVHGLLH